MESKKKYMSPQVARMCGVCLESDLLLGPSGEMKILAAGQDYFEWNTDVEGLYSVDDWVLSD